MLELNVFKQNPSLNFIALGICVRSLLNKVKQWDWFLRFFGCLQLLVLLDNGFSCL